MLGRVEKKYGVVVVGGGPAGLGAALGIKLACPDETVIATVGDGSYMFSVPSASHFVSTAYQLPILTIVYNNQSWHAVKRATCNLHPDGWAVRTNRFFHGEHLIQNLFFCLESHLCPPWY